MIGLVVIVLFITLLAYYAVRFFRRSQRDLPKSKEKLLSIEQDFESFKNRFLDDTRYLRFSKLAHFKNELEKIKEETKSIKNILIRKEVLGTIQKIVSFEMNLQKQREAVNESFFQKEKQRASSIFYDENGKDLLTDEQVRAVLSDDDRNLIIAGAGSGKTRVIDFKVRYLVNYKKISPSKIILLSFSRKSASDLVKKISESVPGIEARTIHSFSSHVTGRTDRKLFDDSKKEFESFVIKALVQTLKDKEANGFFEEFYKKYFTGVKPLIFYKSMNELREDLKKQNAKLERGDQFEEFIIQRAFKTLKGDQVRSIDERYIADFLYLQNINYEYERRYPLSKDYYYPDFYLSDYDVYLEHFGIDSNGNPPSYFDNPEKYLRGMEWKRELHTKNKTKLIESFSYLLNEGNTSTYLSKLLTNNGIEINELLEQDGAFRKISREFSQMFSKFYTTYKLSGLSFTDLKKGFTDPRHSIFIKLFERFHKNYESLVEEENRMDFNDMIINAAKAYQNDFGKSFDYIIVDEFQDTSNLAMKLLNEVYQSGGNSSFLSVGDDWQSIYGFNGSDVTILSSYEKKYDGVTIQKLNSNFRSHSRIVDLGKRFISKNPTQISKNVVSKNTHFELSQVDFLSFQHMEDKILSIPDDESIFILYRYNDDSPGDKGIFRNYFTKDRYGKFVRRTNCKKNISLMTIHASKGLEARHVFLLFPDGVRRKFPSEIEDHFVFNILKTNSEEFPFPEERRLMYVAITRAEQNLYFVSQGGRDPNSVFWDELKEMV